MPKSLSATEAQLQQNYLGGLMSERILDELRPHLSPLPKNYMDWLTSSTFTEATERRYVEEIPEAIGLLSPVLFTKIDTSQLVLTLPWEDSFVTAARSGATSLTSWLNKRGTDT